MNEDDKPPFIDLHESEWTREGKKEPFFGENGAQFLIMFLAGFPISALAALLVTGELPYYLRHFLQ